jgi:hypothetical protein
VGLKIKGRRDLIARTTLKLPNLVPRKSIFIYFRIELTAVIKYGLNASLFSSASFGPRYHAADSNTCRSPLGFSRGTGTYDCGGSNLFPTDASDQLRR